MTPEDDVCSFCRNCVARPENGACRPDPEIGDANFKCAL